MEPEQHTAGKLKFSSIADLQAQLRSLPPDSTLAPSVFVGMLEAVSHEFRELVALLNKHLSKQIVQQIRRSSDLTQKQLEALDRKHAQTIALKNAQISTMREHNNELAWEIARLKGEPTPSARYYADV
jgi:hypothetical protein